MDGSPLPAEWRVDDALTAYLEENGFQREQYDAKTTPASLLGVRFSVPNTKKHRWAIMLHDLHHIATGFGTDLAGEGELSAWEARNGVRPLGLYVGMLVMSGTLLGVALAPRRALAAWRGAARGRALWSMNAEYTHLLGLTVGELRSLLGLPRAGLARAPRKRHAHAPK
jgi:hypothetical protein